MVSSKYVEVRPDENFERIMKPDGTTVGQVPEVSDDELLRWYSAFVRTRVTEDLALKMQRRGVFSVAGSSCGEEACGLGAAAALRDGDWLHPSYRQTSALLYWNLPLDRMLASMLGHAVEHVREHLPIAVGDAPKVRMSPYPVFLGANLPIAVGTSLADKLSGNDSVSLVFIGEGATSEGDFHDALGLAGVLRTPTVFFIQNNQWCISIPANRQTAAKTFAQKAEAHGLPWRRVDGNDVFAVFKAVSDAIANARNGGGATVIEGVTYRMFDHNSADSAALYREDAEREYWAGCDPFERFERYLEHRGILSDQIKSECKEAAEVDFRSAVKRAQKIPPTPPHSMFDNHLHGDSGWSVRLQEWELTEELNGRNPFAEESEFNS